MTDTLKLSFETNLDEIDKQRAALAASFRKDFEALKKQLKDTFKEGFADIDSAEIKQLNKALADAEKNLKTLEKAGKSRPIKQQSEDADEAENSIANLTKQYKAAKLSLEQLDRNDPKFDEQATEVRLLNQQLSDYRKQISGANRTTGAAEDSINGLREQVKKLTREYNNLDKAQREGTGGQELQRRLRSTTDQLKSLESAVGNNRRNVGNYSDALKGLGGSLGKVSSLLGGLGLVGIASEFADLTRRVIEFGVASVDAFRDFETSVAEVRTLLPTLNDVGFDKLIGDVRELGVEIGRTSDETLPALYQALSAGVPSDNVIEFLRTANDAARAGVTDLETSVDTLSSVVNAYGDDVISAKEASDAIFTAVRLGKTTFSEIGESISKVTPLAASLGVSFDDVTASIAVLTAGGTPTAQAVTQISAALSELTKPTTKVSQLFDQLTGQSFREFIAGGGDLQQALAIIADGANEAGIELAGVFGRKEGLLATLALAGDNADKFASALEEVRGASGATDTAADQFSKTLQIQEDKIIAANEELKLLVGEGLKPTKLALLELQGVALEFLADGLVTHRSQTELKALSKEAENAFETLAKGSDAFYGLEKSIFSFDNSTAQASQRAKAAGDAIRKAFKLDDELRAFEIASRKIEEGFKGTEDALVALVKAELLNQKTSAAALKMSIEQEAALKNQSTALAKTTDAVEEYSDKLADFSKQYASNIKSLNKAVEDGLLNQAQAVALLEEEIGDRQLAAELLADQRRESLSLTDSISAEIEKNKEKQAVLERLNLAVEDGLITAESANNLRSITTESLDVLIGKLEEEAQVRHAIEEAVAQGTITQEQANGLLADSTLTVDSATESIDAYAEANRQAAEASRLAAEKLQELNETLANYFLEALKAEEISLNEQLFQQGVNAGLTAEQMALLGVATGQFTEEQAIAAIKTALVKATMDELIESYKAGDLSLQGVITGAKNFQAELDNTDIALDVTNEKVTGLDGSLTDLVDAPHEVVITDNTDDVQQNADDYIAKIGDVDALSPDIVYADNSSDAIANADAVKARADSAAGQRNINYNITTTGAPPPGSPATPFNRGGRFVSNQPVLVGDAKGGKLTPFSEIIVPDSSGLVVSNDQLKTAINVIRSGDIPSLMNYVLNDTPTIRSPSEAPALPGQPVLSEAYMQSAVPQIAMPPSIASTVKTEHNDKRTVDNSLTINVTGDQGERTIRSVIDAYNRDEHHRIMGDK